MKFRNLLFAFTLLLVADQLLAQKIEIGILNDKTPKKLLIEASSGKYKVKSQNKAIYRLKKDRSIILNYANGFINVSNAKKDFGLHSQLFIEAKKYKYDKSHDQINSKKNSDLTLKMIDPKMDAKIYQGNMGIVASGKNMLIENHIGLSDYIAGVVDAESGPKAEEEYYKNQAQ